MKTIEVLYSEFGNMYGEIYNVMMLEKCNKNIKVVYTKFSDEPYFVNHKVDMVYIGNLRDNKTYLVLNELKKYKEKIRTMIESNIIFLLTGNALELFGKYIDEKGKKTEALNIFNYYVVKDFRKKYASWMLGKYNDIKIIGHRNQFSKCYNIKHKFIKVIGGFGSDLESDNEGINYKNFFATYMLGPFLIMNPYFSKIILEKLDKNFKLIYEEDSINAFNERLRYFEKKGARFIMTGHG